MEQVLDLELELKEHTPIANKWLILLSGINKNAVDANGKKVYEQHKFHIPKRWLHPVKRKSWSHTMINQILAYCSLVDSNGEIGVVSLSKLSKLLNCSIKSLEENNKKFLALNLIELEQLHSNNVHIRLVDYKKNFLDLYDHNIKGSFKVAQDNLISKNNNEDSQLFSLTGYTTISRTALLDFFKIQRVNEARIACRAFYVFEKEVNVSGGKSAYITERDLKGILPAYFTRRNKLVKAFEKLNSNGLFNCGFLEKDNAIDALKQNQRELNQKITRNVIEKLKSSFLFSVTLDVAKDSRRIINQAQSVAAESLNFFTDKVGISRFDMQQIRSLAMEFSTKAIEDGIGECLALFDIEYKFGGSDESSTFLEQFYNKPVQTLREYFSKFQNESRGEMM